MREYQCGFKKGKSTIDHIHTIGQIVEKYYEYNRDFHKVFIDFKEAYDSTRIMEDYEIFWYSLRIHRQ